MRLAGVIVLTVCLALSAMAAEVSKLTRSDGKVVISGVDALGWNKDQDCTYIGALTALAHSLGDNVSYDYLMGTSGMAFRVHRWVNGWCPSAGCAGPGFNIPGNALKVLGYKTKFYGWYEGKPASEAMAGMRVPIMDSIDKGHPVMYLNMDDGLIAGYSDGGKKLICRTYSDKDASYSEISDWPWCISVFESKGMPLKRKQAVLESLRYALELAKTEKFGDYYSGAPAYAQWERALLDKASFDDAKASAGAAQANTFTYAVLVDCRAAAVRYLKSVSGDLGPKSKPHLVKAAGIYAEVAKKLESGRQFATREDWDQEKRNSEAAVLKDVSTLETKAVAELKAALDAAK